MAGDVDGEKDSSLPEVEDLLRKKPRADMRLLGGLPEVSPTTATTHVVSSLSPRALIAFATTRSATCLVVTRSATFVTIFATFSGDSASQQPSEQRTTTPHGGIGTVLSAGSAEITCVQSASPIVRATASPPGYTLIGPPGVPSAIFA
jgi:hypothetical protein